MSDYSRSEPPNDPHATTEPRLELTIRAVLLGLILSVVMGAANVYVGLRAGMTVSASIPAAVMAMLMLRLLTRRSSILEANQVQTCASAGESLAAGIIFTMPALILVGYWDSFDFWTVSVVALTGGLLGILFMIPMRRVFVVDNKDLPYPEGLACAAVLRAGENEASAEDAKGEARNLILGGLVGAVFKVAAGYLQVLVGTLETARAVGGRVFYFGGDLSPMLVAVGFIVRLNVALLVFIGGALSWLIGIPLYGQAMADEPPVDDAYRIWGEQIRYVGVGAMVMGGISSLISVRHGLVSAVRELSAGLKPVQDGVAATERDISSKLILGIGFACVVMLTVVSAAMTFRRPKQVCLPVWRRPFPAQQRCRGTCSVLGRESVW